MAFYNVMQYILVGLAIAVAILAAVRALSAALGNRETKLTACAGCKLQEFCKKPEKNSVKKCADKVAQVKKQQ